MIIIKKASLIYFSALIFMFNACLAKYKIAQILTMYGEMKSIRASPDNQTLAVALKNKILIFQKDGKRYLENPLFSQDYVVYVMSDDWQHLVVSSDGCALTLYSKYGTEWIFQEIPNADRIQSLGFLGSQYLLVKTNDSIKIFNTSDYTEITDLSVVDILFETTNKNSNVCGYKVCPLRQSIAHRKTKNHLEIYTKDSNQQPQSLHFDNDTISQFGFSPNGAILAVIVNNNEIFFLRKNNLAWESFQSIAKNNISHFCFSQNGIALFSKCVTSCQTYAGLAIIPSEETYQQVTYSATTFKYINGLFEEASKHVSTKPFFFSSNAPLVIYQGNNSTTMLHGYTDYWEKSLKLADNNKATLVTNSGNMMFILSPANKSLDLYTMQDGIRDNTPTARLKCDDFFDKIEFILYLENTDILIKLKPVTSFLSCEKNEVIIISQEATSIKKACT